MEEELIWIHKIKKGETHFFRLLYDRHHQRLYQLCYRFTGNREDAEEQLQEVFMRILKKIDQFAGEASFATWAWRLAVNHLINFTRKENPKTELFSDPGVPGRRPDLSLILEQAIGSLPDGFRQVFILHDRVGLDHDEISKFLGCSASTSRSQLSRARLALRNLLKPSQSEVTA